MRLKIIERNIVKELERENIAVFAGAGLSSGAGYPDWSRLLKDFADELDLSSEKEGDLISLAQFFFNKNARNRNDINQAIKNNFGDETKVSKDMDILAKLPIKTFWTTNYDTLIERTLGKINKKADVKRRIDDLSTYTDERDAIVYKMHGDVTDPNNAVIIRDDYEEYSMNRGLFVDTLCGDLVSKTFLFIGYSFRDPNFERILSRIRISLKNNRRKHYAFIKKVNRKDYVEEEDFIYDKAKQELRIDDLKQYSIFAIEVESYDEITTFLRGVQLKLYSRNIFISGSAHIYGKDWNAITAGSFIRKLTESLVELDKKVISGYGLGVGGYVIEGASNAIFSNRLDVGKHFEVNPFPQKIDGITDFNDVWYGYRSKMISRCNCAIFLFGNKEDKDTKELVDADGVYKEYKIALELGVKVIPLGATGYVAEKILSEIKNSIEEFKYLEKYIDRLMLSKDVQEIVGIVKKIMEEEL